MSEDLEAKLKVGLLAVIAVTLIINTWMQAGNSRPVYDTAPPPSGTEVMQGTNMVTPGANAAQQPATSLANNLTTPGAATTPAATDNKPTTSIQFAQYDHDFGTIKQNTTNTKVFEFTNAGTNPLVITGAKGSCGCTVPDYPKEPILPGEKSKITVTYSPGQKEGDQNNTVTITANTNPPTTIVRIKANVVPE